MCRATAWLGCAPLGHNQRSNDMTSLTSSDNQVAQPTSQLSRIPIFIALLPVLMLVALLATSLQLFADGASFGPNQVVLILCSAFAACLGMFYGIPWKALEQSIASTVASSFNALLIMLLIGALIASFLLSGTVPTLIYYGLALIDPLWFFPTTAILCALVAMSIGSSWTTAGTIGVALMGIANGLQLDPAICAGAVISGAYFGDKLSPLSETTNLAPATSGAGLFHHIRFMSRTSIPAFLMALVLFAVLGFDQHHAPDLSTVSGLQQDISALFTPGLIHLSPMLLLVVLAIRGVPALPAIFIASLFAAIWALVFQSEALGLYAGGQQQSAIVVIWQGVFAGVSMEASSSQVNSLLSGGGIAGMLNTLWLAISAFVFGAIMEQTGFLQRILQAILVLANTSRKLIASTVMTSFGTNLITGDQYMAIVMPGRMYKEEYQQQNMEAVNLSRAIEDGGTITSPLIPWNACGVFLFGVLSVGTLEYLPYTFFNIISPILGMLTALLGFNIATRKVAKIDTPRLWNRKYSKENESEKHTFMHVVEFVIGWSGTSDS